MKPPSDPSGQLDLAHLVLERRFAGDQGPGYSVNEAVAVYGGEAKSLQPWTIECPLIGWYAWKLNDEMPGDVRQRLIPYIPQLAASKSTPEVEARRAYLIADWVVRRTGPRRLRAGALKLEAHAVRAAAVESTGPITASMATTMADRMQRLAAKLEGLAAITNQKTARKASKAAEAAMSAIAKDAVKVGSDAYETMAYLDQTAELTAKQETDDWPGIAVGAAASAVISDARSLSGSWPSENAGPEHMVDWDDSLRLLEALLAVTR